MSSPWYQPEKWNGIQATPLPTRSVTSAFTLALALVLGAVDPDPLPVLDAALGRIRRVDLDEHVLLQFGEPAVRARLLAAALVFDETAGGEDDREVAWRCSSRPPPSAPRSRYSACGTAARPAASDTSRRGPAAASRSARGGPGSGPAGSRRSPAPCRCRRGSRRARGRRAGCRPRGRSPSSPRRRCCRRCAG